jgi:hypothetical protein
MAVRRLNRESLDAPRGLLPYKEPCRGAPCRRDRRFVVRVSRDGENTVAMSAEERRNEDG